MSSIQQDNFTFDSEVPLLQLTSESELDLSKARRSCCKILQERTIYYEHMF